MFVCTCTYEHICTYKHTCAYEHTCTCTYELHMYMYVQTCACLYIHGVTSVAAELVPPPSL